MLSVNWLAFNYDIFDGYGRYSRHLVRALNHIGVDVTPLLFGQVRLAGWLQRLSGIDYSKVTIACMPPYMLFPVGGQQWNLTMTEGTLLPEGWAHIINLRSQRVIVPCEHNAASFADSGVAVPIHVIHGGTDGGEFKTLRRRYGNGEAYTFLALADRGSRKGWVEVWQAFYKAFGTPEDTPDVRLIIKTRNADNPNSLIDRIAHGGGNPRVSFWREDVDSMTDVYSMCDCFAIPSRSEGWGMPHREAAIMGLPVIVTRNSGVDDGHTDEWALVVEESKTASIPATFPNCKGTWEIADIPALAEKMRWCYENREEAAEHGRKASTWLRENQSWEHSARAIKALLERHNNGINGNSQDGPTS